MLLPHRLTLAAGLAGVLAGWSPEGLIRPVGPRSSPATGVETEHGPGTSTTTMAINGCDFTVTYTWPGFAGKNLIATVGLFNHVPPVDVGISPFNSNTPGQSGKGGTVTQIFHLTANAYPAGRQIVGRGGLVESRKYSQLNGSGSASTAFFSTCG